MRSDIFMQDDNFLNENEIFAVETGIWNCEFRYQPETGSAEDGLSGVVGDNFGEFPMFVSGSNIPNAPSQVQDIANFVVSRFLDKHRFIITEEIRARSNMTFRSLDTRPSRPHVDVDKEHYVFLYYVNDSDGDTILYDQISDRVTSYTQEDLTEFKRVSPKAGRALLFSGNRFHAWYGPQDSYARCVINMNLSLDERSFNGREFN